MVGFCIHFVSIFMPRTYKHRKRNSGSQRNIFHSVSLPKTCMRLLHATFLLLKTSSIFCIFFMNFFCFQTFVCGHWLPPGSPTVAFALCVVRVSFLSSIGVLHSLPAAFGTCVQGPRRRRGCPSSRRGRRSEAPSPTRGAGRAPTSTAGSASPATGRRSLFRKRCAPGWAWLAATCPFPI